MHSIERLDMWVSFSLLLVFGKDCICNGMSFPKEHLSFCIFPTFPPSKGLYEFTVVLKIITLPFICDFVQFDLFLRKGFFKFLR